MKPAELHKHITFTVTAEDILRADMDYVYGYDPIVHALKRLWPDMAINDCDRALKVAFGVTALEHGPGVSFSQEGPEDIVWYDFGPDALEYLDVWRTVRRVHPYTFTISREATP